MRMNSVNKKVVLCLFIFAFFVTATLSSFAAEYVIKYAGTPAASMDNPEYLAMVQFKEIVEEKTEGNVKVEIYPANQLGATKEFTEGVALGTIEMAEVGYDILGLIDPMCYTLTLPYLHSTLEHYIEVVEGPIGEEINQHLINTSDIRILGALNRGPRQMMNGVRPVRTPEDLKGLKIRSPENPLNAGTVRSMGATPVPMTWSEVYTALSQGVVDGVENAIDELFSQNLHEVQKHLSLTRHIFVAVPIVINETFYKGLPVEYQQIIADAAMETVINRRKSLETSEENALAVMKKSGIEVITDPDIDAFAEGASEVWEEFVNQYDEITWDLINRIKDF
jgi:TRAP-type transport system periplasmic protein